MKFILLSFFILSSAQAFTLNNNFGASFKSSKVKVFVASDTVCTQGVTIDELYSYLKPAVNKFWNEVPTSRLRLVPSGFYGTFPVDINNAVLCSPTDTKCISDAQASAKDLIPGVEGIVIACSRELSNFSSSADVLAVSVPNNFSGRKIKGAVILINDSSSNFKNLSPDDKISVIAHEVGHAIGLGHALNKNPEALMYYKEVGLRRNLAQDDIDGVTYLYPKQVDACGLFGGFGSTIDTNHKGPPFWQMLLTLALMMMIFEVIRMIRKSRTKKLHPAY
jgi:hypothetical protein